MTTDPAAPRSRIVVLRDFLLWWVRHICALLPGRWRTVSSLPANALVLNAVEESRIEIVLRRRHRERSLGFLPADALGPRWLPRRHSNLLVLHLPAKVLLECEFTLPVAAGRHVANILQHEMDRLTPFTSDEVYWEGHVADRDRADGRLTVRLGIILRSSLQPLIDRLAKQDLHPSMAEIVGTAGRPWQIMLDHSLPNPERQRRRKLVTLAGFCIVLALAAIILPFVRQSIVLADLDARIAALRPRADQAAILRRRIAARLAGSDALAAETARFPNPLQVIAILSDVVPDDSFLTSLSLQRRQLAFTGETADAAKLIRALAADTRFVNSAFVGPVNGFTNDKRDQFSIRTELGHLP